MPFALLALAMGGFAIGTGEFVAAGLLPDVADDFGVSVPTAGYLISGYAIGVVIGAPLLTALTTRLRSRASLLLLMAVLTVGNLASALAPTFGSLLAARVFTGLAHGAFFGTGAVVAASLVPPQRRAQALSVMFGGLTFSNVVGVPLGTLLGQSFGWRFTFAAITAIGLVTLAGLLALLPVGPPPQQAQLRLELAAFRSRAVWLSLAVTAVSQGGLFASVTYVAPMMTRVAGYSSGAVPWLLVLFGIGSCVGMWAGGRIADRSLTTSLYAGLAALALVLALFVPGAHLKVTAALALFLLGVTAFALAPVLQVRVMLQAAQAPTLVSAANQAAFNIGNAGGAYLGGLAIAAGLGYAAPNGVGAALVAASIVIVVLARHGAPVLQPQAASARERHAEAAGV